MKWRHRAAGEKPSAPGAIAARCASMLRGGVMPHRVFGLIAEDASVDSVERRVHQLVESGETPGAAIAICATERAEVRRRGRANDTVEWRLLASSWQLAEDTGAPLAAALERISAALLTLRRLRERRDVLVSGPKATTRLVAALPPLVLVMGWLLGFDPSPVLLSWAGVCMVSVGLVLLAAGVYWAHRLTQQLQAQDRVAGIELELVWIALGGGASPNDAVRQVVDCLDRTGNDWVEFDRFCADGTLAEIVRRAHSTGVPLGPLLLSEAAALRVSSHAVLESAAERLGVRILIPLGLCVLPSFIVMGVLPVVISMVGNRPF
ncbi:hypothetical protein G7068_12685 [Leucobacter viscericola]|uniref:Type II secretion system protein GspF domain-containing protein n=1 Tax=Leucobacter viscericola TaxID=2714935 RepID=A0A6G7XHW2_9MICO|nr:type II secretion system F family protein [Leucobacter viscericola]QIK63958.1 hypothetical protein G7068_12685 [Leucobacter viscericola]